MGNWELCQSGKSPHKNLTGRYIYWEGEIEFCADALRIKGTVIDEDYYLNKAMDEGKNTHLYSCAEALVFLED